MVRGVSRAVSTWPQVRPSWCQEEVQWRLSPEIWKYFFYDRSTVKIIIDFIMKVSIINHVHQTNILRYDNGKIYWRMITWRWRLLGFFLLSYADLFLKSYKLFLVPNYWKCSETYARTIYLINKVFILRCWDLEIFYQKNCFK